MPRPLAFAEDLDLLGVPLFRLGPGDAVKGRYQKPHTGWPGRSANTNDQAIAGWKPGHALAAIGGRVVDILDFDLKHGGRETFNRMNAAGQLPSVRFSVATPSGGLHLYVDAQGMGTSKPRANDPAERLPGLDYQGRGAFVLCPPTDGYRVLLNSDWLEGWDRITPPTPDSAERFRRAIAGRYPATSPVPVVADRSRPPTREELEKAKSVLDKACREVRNAAGGRNNAVSRHLLPLFNFVLADCLERDDVEAGLWAAVLAAPGDHEYTRQEFEASCESAWRKAQPERPRVDSPADDFAMVPDQGERPAGILERFPRVSLADLLDPNQPPREYVVDPMLLAGAAYAFVAPAGHMKSLIALGLAVAVAKGAPEFAGMPIPKPRRVLVVDMENTTDDLRERLLSFGVGPEDEAVLERLVLLSLPSLSPLDTKAGGEELLQILDAYGLEPGDLVVLDSYQRVTEAGENDSDTTRGYYRHTGIHLKARGLTVIRTDNTGKDASRGARGSSGKRDDVDVEYLMTSDGSTVEISTGKVRQRGVSGLAIRVERVGDVTTFSSNHTPREHRRLDECVAWLEEVSLDPALSQRRAELWLKQEHGDKLPFTRSVIRAALARRRECFEDFGARREGAARSVLDGSVEGAPPQGGAVRRGEEMEA